MSSERARTRAAVVPAAASLATARGPGQGARPRPPRTPAPGATPDAIRAAAAPHPDGGGGGPEAGGPDTRARSRLESLCIQRGLKMTGQRRTIARVLSDADDHPDVEEVYRRASAIDRKMSIATVYRTVRLFEEAGILERRDFGGGRARYEPSEAVQHYHLIDIDTGRVIEFDDAAHEALLRGIAAKLGFDLVSTRLALFGRARTRGGRG